MQHDIVHYAKTRHTVKAYDTSKKISNENIEKVKELLRFSASSTNAQPWHFLMISTEEGKQRVAKANESMFPFNNPSILAASHVVIFCSRLTIEDDHLSKVLEQEEIDGRFTADPTFKDKMDQGRKFFINIHKHDLKDVQHWMDKQVYLNVGAFLLGVSTLGIDATPMEGIDIKSIDQEFGLREKGYTSLVAVTLGYHDPEKDYNANLPKSRLPYDYILSEI
ncbi:MAG: oxygen-insensitive NAD(P)H nitroreductase [Alphaproteobacteria bacterium]|nr:oxygen-insensitive NAD(P)H nitroreductase [Alphaproteobacteria bacterium]|tara:strand:+ start:6910 stop:7575 length:666 start_codon:yes stop_codon:yes gene_type:complete